MEMQKGHQLFRSLLTATASDVSSYIFTLRNEEHMYLDDMFKTKKGFMWFFLSDLSSLNIKNENCYFHFYFLQNVFERIDGSIQNFVSSDGYPK